MAVWQVQDAKARFSELLDKTLENGPQVVSRRGVNAAVLVPIDQWERLQQRSRPSLKEWLLTRSGRTEDLVAKRGKTKARKLAEFE